MATNHQWNKLDVVVKNVKDSTFENWCCYTSRLECNKEKEKENWNIKIWASKLKKII